MKKISSLLISFNNSIQPKVEDFRRFYIKALEEFNWYDLYSYIKNTLKNWSRVSLDSINNLKFCSYFS